LSSLVKQTEYLAIGGHSRISLWGSTEPSLFSAQFGVVDIRFVLFILYSEDIVFFSKRMSDQASTSEDRCLHLYTQKTAVREALLLGVQF